MEIEDRNDATIEERGLRLGQLGIQSDISLIYITVDSSYCFWYSTKLQQLAELWFNGAASNQLIDFKYYCLRNKFWLISHLGEFLFCAVKVALEKNSKKGESFNENLQRYVMSGVWLKIENLFLVCLVWTSHMIASEILFCLFFMPIS